MNLTPQQRAFAKYCDDICAHISTCVTCSDNLGTGIECPLGTAISESAAHSMGTDRSTLAGWVLALARDYP